MEEVNEGSGNVPRRGLRREPRFWAASTLLFAAIAVLKGFRWPESWAASQAQVDYGEGFVKRGLFGATVTKALHLNHYVRFAVVSTLLLLGLLVVVYLFEESSDVRRRAGGWLPVAAFAASYSVTYLAHLNGYLDVVLAMLAIAVLTVREPRWRLVVGAPVVVAALLMHEMFLLTFLPVVLLSFVLQVWAERNGARRGRVLAGATALGLLACGITVGLALRAPLSAAAAGTAMRRLQARADFPLRPDVFAVLYVSGAENLRLAMAFARQRAWWLHQAVCVLLYLPFVGFTLSLVFRLIERSGVARRRWLFALCVGASLCPLLMNLLGLDMGRWYALVGLATFLVLCTTCRYLRGPSLELSPGLRHAGWVVVALGMASGGMLMDQKVIVPYPFLTLGIGHSLRLPMPSAL